MTTPAAEPTPEAPFDPLAAFRTEPQLATTPDVVPETDAPAIVFDVDPDTDDPLAAIVHQAVGAASVCWEKPQGAGVFDDVKARDVADSLLYVLRSTQILAGPDDQEVAVAVLIAAWHADPTALGFLHKGGVCGCHYLANLSVRSILPALVVA
jgi:hypothetical protein